VRRLRRTVSLGHAGFLAVGAYASAILTQRLGWHLSRADRRRIADGGDRLCWPAGAPERAVLAVVTLGWPGGAAAGGYFRR
jgi:ABC-type branched-subunit amino acid transport system permease subunit